MPPRHRGPGFGGPRPPRRGGPGFGGQRPPMRGGPGFGGPRRPMHGGFGFGRPGMGPPPAPSPKTVWRQMGHAVRLPWLYTACAADGSGRDCGFPADCRNNHLTADAR